MPITYVAAAVGGGNTASFNLTWPAVDAGDFALAFWVMSTSVTPTTPTGFSLVATNDNAANGALRTYIFSKFCDGTEGATALTLAVGLTTRHAGGLSIYRGVDPITPVDQIGWLAETVSGTTHICPTVTPTGDDCCIVTAVYERSTIGTDNWTAPDPGFVETVDTLTSATGTGGTILAVADDGLATFWPGGVPVTPPVWTSANAFATPNVGTYTLALTKAVQVQSEGSQNAHMMQGPAGLG